MVDVQRWGWWFVRIYVVSAGRTYERSSEVLPTATTFFSFSTPPAAKPQAFVFDTCGGDSFKAELKLAGMKTAVRKHGTSGNRRISLFGTLVGWLHEQSYIPQARRA